MKIIVNADDFGKSEMITYAIDEAMQRNLITETTALANGAYIEEAIRLARKHGYLSRVGVHCCLTEGTPISSKILTLTGFTKDGTFHGNIHGRKGYSAEEKEAIEEEISAQIRLLERITQESVRHMDSHHHVHMLMNLMEPFNNTIRKHGIKWVRNYRNMKTYLTLSSRVKDKIKALKYKRCFDMFTYSEYMGSIDEIVTSKKRLLNDCCVEIMVHPQYDKDGALIDRVHYDNEQHEFLLSDCLKSLLDELNVHVISSIEEIMNSGR